MAEEWKKLTFQNASLIVDRALVSERSEVQVHAYCGTGCGAMERH
jgi:hypothetical protein